MPECWQMLLPYLFLLVTDVESPLLRHDRWTAIYVISGRYCVWCRLMLCLLILDWCYVHWLMLLPIYITIGVIRLRTDVIALIGYGRCYCQVADGIATGWTILFLVGRCYSHVADVITTGWIYFNFSSELFNRTSSHIWGRWYLPIFFLIFKEVIYIRVNNPSLNRKIGKYHLPHIWDEVLLNNSELVKINPPSGDNICHMAITSANQKQYSSPCGYSICHLAITSAITNKGNNISPKPYHSYGYINWQ